MNSEELVKLAARAGRLRLFVIFSGASFFLSFLAAKAWA